MAYKFDKKRKLLVDSGGYPVNLMNVVAPSSTSTSVDASVEQEIQNDLQNYVPWSRVLDSNWGMSSVPASNLKAVQFFNFRRAVAQKLYGALGSTANVNANGVKILLLGDSVTMGQGSTVGVTNADGVGNYGIQLRNYLRNNIAPAHYSFAMPGDARFTIAGTGLTLNSGGIATGFCGYVRYHFNRNATGSTITGTLTYAPGTMCDTAVVYVAETSQAQSIPVYVDGSGTPATTIVCQGGSNGWLKWTVPLGTASSSHSIVIGPPTVDSGTGPGDSYVYGVETYTANTAAFQIANIGVSGTLTGNWYDNTTYSSLNGVRAYAPDLTIIMLGINDAHSSVSTSTLTTNLTGIITACKASGDVILMSPTPSGPTDPHSDLQPGYVTAIKALALSQGVGYIGINERFGPNLICQSKGTIGDAVGHPTDAGYQDLALAVYEVLKGILYGSSRI